MEAHEQIPGLRPVFLCLTRNGISHSERDKVGAPLLLKVREYPPPFDDFAGSHGLKPEGNALIRSFIHSSRFFTLGSPAIPPINQIQVNEGITGLWPVYHTGETPVTRITGLWPVYHTGETPVTRVTGLWPVYHTGGTPVTRITGLGPVLSHGRDARYTCHRPRACLSHGRDARYTYYRPLACLSHGRDARYTYHRPRACFITRAGRPLHVSQASGLFYHTGGTRPLHVSQASGLFYPITRRTSPLQERRHPQGARCAGGARPRRQERKF